MSPDDPPPEDGELGYTAPLEGFGHLTEEDLQAPGQITLLELLDDAQPTEEELEAHDHYLGPKRGL